MVGSNLVSVFSFFYSVANRMILSTIEDDVASERFSSTALHIGRLGRARTCTDVSLDVLAT